jgi:phenylglyoxylate dehydrogenase epsilon subunit
MKKHLIIGCGPAALSALDKIRKITAEDEIKLVTRESFLPYSPSILPYLIGGRIPEETIWLKEKDYFKSMKASLESDKEVVSIDPWVKQVTYQSGEEEAYDTLLIATGAKPVLPVIQGLEEGNCFVFHNLSDYHKLKKELAGKKEVVIYGAGLVAVELAMCLLENGYAVKNIARSRLLRRYFNQQVGNFIEDTFRQKGAEIYLQSEVVAVEREKEKMNISLNNSRDLNADLFVLAIGVKPETSFLAGTGLPVKDGIRAGYYLETELPEIYVAGDVAAAPGFFDDQPGINPILPNALAQGKVAGANMAGKQTRYEGWIPVNLFYLFGRQAFSIGLTATADGSEYQVYEEQNRARGQFKKLVFQEDYLVGAQFFNVGVDPGVFRYLITERVKINPYNELLGVQPVETSRWLMLGNEQKSIFTGEEGSK